MNVYFKLNIDLDSFKNLRKLEIFSWCLSGLEVLTLNDLLTKVMTLPEGQLRSFKLVFSWVADESMGEEILLSLFQKQRQSLENLELSFNSKLRFQLIRLPMCMPNLKRLWISSDSDRRTGWGSRWGFTFDSQVAKECANFMAVIDSEMLKKLLVVREGRKCNRESCHTCNDFLVHGKWGPILKQAK